MTAALREPLSRERVLSAAMTVADTEGLPAVTMRRVAAVLGVKAMSLYHHVPGKEPLLDGLIDALIGEIETAFAARQVAARDAARDWRASLRQRCLTAREVMVRHRWARELINSRTAVPARLLGYYDAILATLIDGGFNYHLAHRAIHALGTMALGFAQELFSPGSNAGGLDADAEAQLAAMAAAFPHLTAMVASELHDHHEDPLGWCDSQAEFEFTLDMLLDGLARHQARGNDS